jgi:hypothetical protein
VFFLHVESFRAQGLSAGLVQDPRLSAAFPEKLLAAEGERLPATLAQLPPGRDLALTEYGADGLVLHNRYDSRRENGYPLEKALAWSIERARERYARTSPALDPRATRYFDRGLALLNGMGSRPLVVFMPLHPRLLDAVRDIGWAARRDEVMSYLRELQRRRDFALVDLTRLSSFGGDPDEYYDGFHITAENARRITREIVARAPQSFR